MQKRHSLNDRPAINMLAGISVAPAQKGGSSTKKADLVDGKGKKGQFVHENGRFGGWRTAGDGDGNGAAKQKRGRLERVSLHGVEVVGFEPATPCLQSMCSTS